MEITTYNGIESIILRHLVQALNFDPRIEDMSSKGESVLIRNTTSEVLIGRQRCIFDRYSTQTVTYMSSNLVIVIFKGRPFNSMEKLISPFDSMTWGIVFLWILVATIVLAYLLRKPKTNLARALVIGRRTESPITDLVSVIFANPVRNPEVTFTKFLLMCWVVLCLILRVAYQANLYGILKSDRLHPIPRNLQEVVTRGYSLYATEHIQRFLGNIPEITKLIYVTDSFVNRLNKDSKLSDMMMMDWLAEQKVDAKKAVIVTEEAFYFYKKQFPDKSKELTLVEGKVLTQSIAFSLRKQSIYKPYLDEVLVGMMSGGLIDLWRRNSTWFKGSCFEKQRKEDIVLNIEKISFAFHLFFGGCMIGFVVFCFEYFREY